MLIIITINAIICSWWTRPSSLRYRTCSRRVWHPLSFRTFCSSARSLIPSCSTASSPCPVPLSNTQIVVSCAQRAIRHGSISWSPSEWCPSCICNNVPEMHADLLRRQRLRISELVLVVNSIEYPHKERANLLAIYVGCVGLSKSITAGQAAVAFTIFASVM